MEKGKKCRTGESDVSWHFFGRASISRATIPLMLQNPKLFKKSACRCVCARGGCVMRQWQRFWRLFICSTLKAGWGDRLCLAQQVSLSLCLAPSHSSVFCLYSTAFLFLSSPTLLLLLTTVFFSPIPITYNYSFHTYTHSCMVCTVCGLPLSTSRFPWRLQDFWRSKRSSGTEF